MVGAWHPISWLTLSPIYSRMTYRASSYRNPPIQILWVVSRPLQSAGCLFARWRGVGREGGRGELAVLSPGEGGARAVRLQRDYLVPSVGTLPRRHPAGKGPLEGNADPFGQPVHYTALTALQGYLLTITVWHIKGKKKLCKDLRPVDKPFSLPGFPVSGGLCVLGNRSTETRTQKLCTQVWPWDFWSQFYFRGRCQGAELCGTPGRWDLAGRGHATLHTTGAGDASVLPTLTLNIRAHSASFTLPVPQVFWFQAASWFFFAAKKRVWSSQSTSPCALVKRGAVILPLAGGSSRQAEQAASFHRVRGGGVYIITDLYTLKCISIYVCVYIFI